MTNFRTGQLRDTNNVPFQFVQEVQIKSSGFDAEYGGATGGVINVVTKSGSNDFHGEFGVQFETSNLSSRLNLTGKVNNSDPQYLANPTILDNSSTTLLYINPPGDSFLNFFPSATLSGPVIKNRLWFLVSSAPQFYHTERDFNFRNGAFRHYERSCVMTIRSRASTGRSRIPCVSRALSPTAPSASMDRFLPTRPLRRQRRTSLNWVDASQPIT